MYNLDVETWQPKLHKRTDYMYIGMGDGRELRAEYYGSDQPDNDKVIDETMCCMGPGWFLSAEQFWRQGGCDEGHGSWGQQGVEVSLKAWLSGNALMVDKRTWFAHWFRGGGGPGFPYQISGRAVEAARSYSRDLWLNDRWPLATRKLSWLVEKFNPPGWGGVMSTDKQMALNVEMYRWLHTHHHEPRWRGVQVIKMPTDLLLYEQVIWENRPRWIIETGTKYGGSALFLQDALDLVGEGGRIVTIDNRPSERKVTDARITYIEASSTDRSTVQQVREMVGSDTVMVILDSSHKIGRAHV